MKQLQSVISNAWRQDGDLSNCYVIRIPDTGKSDTAYVLTNPMGRDPVGVQIIRKNMPIDVYVTSANVDTITVKFTLDNANINLRVW